MILAATATSTSLTARPVDTTRISAAAGGVQVVAASVYTGGNGILLTGNSFSAITANSARIVVSGSGIDLATGVIAAPGTYRSVTVDTYGRITAGSNPTTLAGYGITDAQPVDPTLTALAALVTAADKLIYSTGVDTFSQAALTAFARTLIAAVDAASMRTVLGLGTIATQNANAVAITGGTIDGIVLDAGTF